MLREERQGHFRIKLKISRITRQSTKEERERKNIYIRRKLRRRDYIQIDFIRKFQAIKSLKSVEYKIEGYTSFNEKRERENSVLHLQMITF